MSTETPWDMRVNLYRDHRLGTLAARFGLVLGVLFP